MLKSAFIFAAGLLATLGGAWLVNISSCECWMGMVGLIVGPIGFFVSLYGLSDLLYRAMKE